MADAQIIGSMAAKLTPSQLHDLEITERVASCFSLVGTTFILVTFIYSPSFRKPVNRFLPADALWNLAMALNVYLTIFRKYSPERLKSLEWRYHIMCYGLPFIIAFIYIFISTPGRGKIYGDAVLWCWIDIKWVFLRIALCYAQAWFCIITSFCIYVFAGREIFKKRQQLREFNAPAGHVAPIENPFITTQIHVTSELAPWRASEPNSYQAPISADHSPLHPRYPTPIANKAYDAYSVTIETEPSDVVVTEALRMPTPQTSRALQQRNNRAALEANRAAFGYTKVAVLFFISLLVTWVPSSVNRVYSLIYPDRVSLPAAYASGVVLPLMGFWNSVIYIFTSWTAVSDLFRGKLSPPTPLRRHARNFSRSDMGNRRRKGSASDSIKGLKFSSFDRV